jgi:hypothetical protein
MEVDGTGSGSCPVAGFGISGVEPSDCATRGVVSIANVLWSCCDIRWCSVNI